MAIRIHLFDPDALLKRLRGPIEVLWGRWGALAWLLAVLPALVLLPPHWVELTGNFSDRVLAAQNLLLLWLVFPVIKALHEFGHAAATRRGGGEVHDVGIVLLVLVPVPYVEASASSVFRSKWERALVAASGMAVELFVAALAFYLWLLVEPSVLRAVLFNVMVVAGVSTLVFNGNPLLRYDAYYILADLLEMPNLAQRSLRYWSYLVERYAFGVDEATTPEQGARDKAWLIAYGLLSSCYRVMVTVAIALFIAREFFFVGVVLAIWAVVAMSVVPLVRGLGHVAGSKRLRKHRARVWAVTSGFAAVLAALLFVVPAPSRTVLEGVAWLPASALVRAGEEGIVERLRVAPGTRVAAGEVLVELRNPALQARHDAAAARVAELDAQYLAALNADRSQAAILREQLQSARSEQDSLAQRLEALAVRAATPGVFVVPRPQDLAGRWQRQGDLIGYVLERPQPLARVVATQDSADAVRSPGTRVEVRLAHQPDRVLAARLEREVPAGESYLPSRVLAQEGGGQLATDARDGHGDRTLERTFQFDVAILPPGPQPLAVFFGERVHARFDHPPEPIGLQWLRTARRLFLSQFHV